MLVVRRDRGDLIQFFKILKGYNAVNWHSGIHTTSALNLGGPCNGIRGEKHRLAPQLTNCEKIKKFISNRVAANWNKLLAHIVASSSVNKFKNRLDAYSATRLIGTGYHSEIRWDFASSVYLRLTFFYYIHYINLTII